MHIFWTYDWKSDVFNAKSIEILEESGSLEILEESGSFCFRVWNALGKGELRLKYFI